MNYPSEILENIRKHLVKESKRLSKTITSLKEQDPYSDPERLIDNAASDTDAKEESSHERMEAIEKELKLNLSDVRDALLRIEKGTYGKCQTCGQLIDTDRLAVNPTAQMCVECEKNKHRTTA